MMTLQLDINTDDKQVIELLKKNIIKAEVFNGVEVINIKIVDTVKEDTKKEPKRKKGKWANFVKDMTSVLDSETAEHIRKSSEEFKSNFQFRNLQLNQ